MCPDSFPQIPKLTRYQLREYLRSRRSSRSSRSSSHRRDPDGGRGALIAAASSRTNLAFYGSFWGGGVDLIIVLAAVFFGGDAIAGEFQNKTGYFLMGLPLRRSTVYLGKFIAAFLASVAMLLLFLVILLANGAYYFGTGLFPWQLGLSLLLAVCYLVSVLGFTFLISSLFKTSAYGFVLTVILFLFGFSILESLITGLVKVEPWMIISYAESTIGNVFSSSVELGASGHRHDRATWAVSDELDVHAGIAEGILIMIVYFVVTALAGLALFEREEFN